MSTALCGRQLSNKSWLACRLVYLWQIIAGVEESNLIDRKLSFILLLLLLKLRPKSGISAGSSLLLLSDSSSSSKRRFRQGGGGKPGGSFEN